MSCCNHEHGSHVSLWEEIIAHVPYAAFSLAIGFVILSIMYFVGLTMQDQPIIRQGYHILFHSFHYLHLIFAATGAFIMYMRFSKSVVMGLIVAFFSSTVFCTLSDVMFPALAGDILGVHMHMHVCFFEYHDLMNVLPFPIVGLLCGLALSYNKESLQSFSYNSHFIHILVSSLASLFYMVAHGFDAWYESMGLLFFFLIIAVVVPCTLSDVVVPLLFAQNKKHAKKGAHNEKHSR